MKKNWQVLDHSGEDSLSYGHYLRDVFADYIRHTECKRLINQIEAAQEREGFKSLAILSNSASEGKSFLAIVLALGFATLLGRKVLLVDAVTQTQGRTLYLDRLLGPALPSGRRGTANEDEPGGVVDLLSTRSAENSHVESCDFQLGPYVEQLKSKYDLILIDTCAIGGADKTNMDPVVVARHVDKAVVLISKDNVDVEALTRLKTNLDSWNIKLLGTVYNSGAVR